jgi:RNA polymerase sigma-70 factor (ECF subfamily)
MLRASINRRVKSENASDLFPTTRYSVIRGAAAAELGFLENFGEIFRIYRDPIYKCIRRSGLDHHDAEDLLQLYFTDLQRRDYVASFDAKRGKFRAFIQTDLKLFLNNQRKKTRQSTALNGLIETLNVGDAQQCTMDRDWANATLREAIEVACRECGKTESRVALFKALAPLLDKNPSAGQYDELARRFGKSRQSLAVDMTRLRKNFGRTLERLVRKGLGSEHQDEARAEINYLFEVLRGIGD